MMRTREGSGRIQLPGLDVYRSFDWVRLARPGMDSAATRDFSLPLRIPGTTEVPERGISLKIELVNAGAVYNNQMNALDWDRCAGALELRNWRPGDRIHLENTSDSEKIKTLFQEFRVPLWDRRNWPVIVRGESILWAGQFGADRDAAPGPSTKTLAVITLNTVDPGHRTETRESKDGSTASKEERRRGPGNSKRARESGKSGAREPGAEVL
jgi:tRNA(Ile)-lysidine synthase